MKKIICMMLVLIMALTAFVACKKPEEKADVKGEGVMTYAEYKAAKVDDPVVIETYVQAKQSWWEDKATLYTADKDGAYFIYNAACTQELYDKLVPGTKIKVTGFKGEWAGEVEVAEGATIEIEEGNYVAAPVDLTEVFGKDELIDHQNELFTVKGLTVAGMDDGAAYWYSYDNSGEEGSDLYFKVKLGEEVYTFTVESYLCGADSEVYKAVKELVVGGTIDVEGFLYWYEGVNPHITKVTVK